MRPIYWILPLALVLGLTGCVKGGSEFDGKWVDVDGYKTMEITGNKLEIFYGEWKDSYRYKVREEDGMIYLSNAKGDGSFDGMTELRFLEEEGVLQAWDMLLDAEAISYRFVREENLQKEQEIQDLSEDAPKVIESEKIDSFFLSFENTGECYGLDASWEIGDYTWEIEKDDLGEFHMSFRVMGDSYVAVNYEETISEEYVRGLAKLLSDGSYAEHNGYYLKNPVGSSEYWMEVCYESGEKLQIRAEGEPAESCVFDMKALLDYAAMLDLRYEEE